MTGDGKDVELDAAQKEIFAEMRDAIDALHDGVAMLTRTQDFVELLLRRGADKSLREQTLGEISRYFMGIIRAEDLSDDYRLRRLRQFSKATIRLVLSSRHFIPRDDHDPSKRG